MYTGQKVSTFKERFAELVSESNKTITELSKDLNVSNQTISAWRLGTRSPKDISIPAIANHFGVSIKWLMGFDVEKYVNRTPPDAGIYTKLILGMSPEDYYTVMKIFEKTEIAMREKGEL